MNRIHAREASLQARRIVFPGKQEVCLEPFDLRPPGKGEVLVRTRLSLMSTGTENIAFNRLFDPGTHWDRWVKYPFYPGYSSVGIVETAGPETPFKPGDPVAFGYGHRSGDVLPASECLPIPAGVPFEEAVWFCLAKIAFVGAKAAQHHLGQSVLVIGAGPIGQMAIRWARAAGASPIIVVDAFSSRLGHAREGGAAAVIGSPIEHAREEIMACNEGKLPELVLDTTGNAQVFESALKLAANRGTVVILGDTGQPAKQNLSSDVIIRGLTIRGAHATHNTPEWNTATITRLFFDLARRGCFPLSGLNTHRFAPEQCAEAYAAANRDRAQSMGILFDWADGGGAKAS